MKTDTMEWDCTLTGGHDKHGQSAVWGQDGKTICIVYDGVAHGDLIAAAPTLLEALRGVVHHNDGLKGEYRLSDSLMRQVNDAIAKAEGRR